VSDAPPFPNGGPAGPSWSEASARQRLGLLLDLGSFAEILGPERRVTSPSLPLFDLPLAFDDGMIVGRGTLGGRPVLVAAQEGRFMGGAIGEVHGAKLLGLLRGAIARPTRDPVLILFDSGGVRLQEANAGEVAVAEIMRAVVEARLAGIAVIGLIGGRAGCFGGASLIAGCCSQLVISETGRLSVTGPEVIETNCGVEEFDSRDRALVWRTMGGKHRCLLGMVRFFADDTVDAFRTEAEAALAAGPVLSLDTLRVEHDRLAARLAGLGDAENAETIWARLGVAAPDDVPDADAAAFHDLLFGLGGVTP
jgi:malonate decarboxylase beta subunit